MDYFNFKNEVLFVEGVSLEEVAESVDTPVYIYSKNKIIQNYNYFYNTLRKSLGTSTEILVAYSVKSNSNISIINILNKLQSGADVVSGGELKRAIIAGIKGDKVVFSGVGKTDEEMAYAIDNDILQFNVESINELKRLSEIAILKNKKAPVAIRINPDVKAGAHKNIATGLKGTKFGIDYDDYKNIYNLAKSLKGIEIIGLDVHIGSQITELKPFRNAYEKIYTLVSMLRNEGHNILNIDLGGGIGIKYKKSDNLFSLEEFSKMVAKIFGKLGCKLIFEPGRYISGNSGILLTKIIRKKSTNKSNFIIVDAAMNDFMRPVLYDSFHDIIEVRKKKPTVKGKSYQIVGPICETGDILHNSCVIDNSNEGNLLAILNAGAYGASMSSTYNSRDLIPEVLIDDEKMHIIRKRISVDKMLAFESL